MATPMQRILSNITYSLVLLFSLSSTSHAEQVDLFDQIVQQQPDKKTGDFDRMAEDRLIRVLMPFSKTFYFLDGATARGIEYDSIIAFEQYLNRNIKNPAEKIHLVILPTPRNQLLPRLISGEGDLALGNLTITQERRKSVDFSIPVYGQVNEIVVSHNKSERYTENTQLSGQKVYVRASSSYYNSLLRLNRELKTQNKAPIQLVLMDDLLEDEDLLEMVNIGLIDRIVMDQRKANLWKDILPNIRLDPQLMLREDAQTGWTIRKNSPLLAAEVNGFIKQHRQGTLFGNMLLKRYLENQRWITKANSTYEWQKLQNSLPYFKKYADQYGFDYLMLVALGYQESQLNPKAKSARGAMGIMQVLPSTARYIGFDKFDGLDNNIHAGTKYLRYLIDQYLDDEAMTPLNQTLFAFAAYNAGPSRVRRLRQQAAAAGLDPNSWFGEVEQIAAQEIGRETVQYVSNIFKYYVSYRLTLLKQEAKQQAIEHFKEKTKRNERAMIKKKQLGTLYARNSQPVVLRLYQP